MKLNWLQIYKWAVPGAIGAASAIGIASLFLGFNYVAGFCMGFTAGVLAQMLAMLGLHQHIAAVAFVQVEEQRKAEFQAWVRDIVAFESGGRLSVDDGTPPP